MVPIRPEAEANPILPFRMGLKATSATGGVRFFFTTRETDSLKRHICTDLFILEVRPLFGGIGHHPGLPGCFPKTRFEYFKDHSVCIESV